MPRVEKQIRDRQEDEEKEFANDVLRMMREAVNSEAPFELGATKPERLASVLTFIVTLLRENIRNEGAFSPEDHPRQILAHEAMRMFSDILDSRRHDIHKMFDGVRLAGRPSPSLDMHRGAIVAACVRRVREIDFNKFPNKSDVYRKLARHPELAKHLEDEKKTAGLVDKTEAKKEAEWMIKNFYEALKENGGTTADSVVDRAAYLVGLRHNPLNMHAAMTEKPLNLVIYNPGAKAGEPLPEFITQWAAGKIKVNMKEIERGQWVVKAGNAPISGFASVIECGRPDSSAALRAPSDAPDQS